MGQTTARGLVWLLAQAVAVKGVMVVGQIIVPRLMNDYLTACGNVAIAYTVVSFPSLIQQAGTRQVLIHRFASFRLWANAAFWMSLFLGLLAAGLTLALAPAAAWYYANPSLVGLVSLLMLLAVFNGLGVVPEARLAIDMRFRLQAIYGVLGAVLTIGLTVALALIKTPTFSLGAYALIVPVVVAVGARAAAVWAAAPIRIKLNPQIRRWRFMVNDSGLLLLTTLFHTIILYGDYMILGGMRGSRVVGLYYWAYLLSIQSVTLLSNNLAGVLFPSLSRLQGEPERLRSAFLRAIRSLAIIGIPACLLQAALAGPLIEIVFPQEFQAGIPVLQILSIGMASQMLVNSTLTMIQAQGRFRTGAVLGACSAALFLALVYTGARQAEGEAAATTVAIAVALYFICAGTAHLYAALAPYKGAGRALVGTYVPTLAASALSIGPGYLLAWALPAMPLRPYVMIAVTLAVACPSYLILIRKFARDDWMDARERIVHFLPVSCRRFVP